MVSFDVKSLFTNEHLEKTIEITLGRTCERKEINTLISKKEMKQLLTLCTKIVCFTCDRTVYQQKERVDMESPLWPVLSGIFVVELENSLVPTLNDSAALWRRFVNDMITFVKNDSIVYEYNLLMMQNNKVPFLDVFLIKSTNNVDKTVCKKPTNIDNCLNWNVHAPTTRKRGTLRTILSRA